MRIDPKVIPADVLKIIQALAPDESYIVGGVVRDLAAEALRGNDLSVRNLAAKDWDVATACLPREAMRKLKRAGFAVLPIGIEHGTVVAHPRKDSGEIDATRRYEVTTFRYDRLCDGRHAQVQFANCLEEDLQRRDFTVNAMAINPETGEVLDPQEGLRDLKDRIVRAVGEPEKRFQEDYLRLLRAIRFAVAIQGNIEKRTWDALCANAEGIQKISAERIREEILKILAYSRPSRAFLLMRSCGLLKQVFPELDRCFGVGQNRYHADDVGVHTLLVADAVSPKFPLLRFIALAHDLGKPVTRASLEDKEDPVFYGHEIVGARLAGKVMRRLKFSTREIELAQLLTRVHMYGFQSDISKKTVRRWLHRIGREQFRIFLRLRLADRRGNRRQSAGWEPGFYRVVRMLREIERDQDALDLKDLAINGHDLLDLGMEPGPAMGALLNQILEEVLEDPLVNDRSTLLQWAREALKNAQGNLGDSGFL